MKNTLLALMLVSSLFVISCGADATKPGDAYKSQPTETVTGTKTINTGVNAGVVQDFVTTPGEKVTEIVQVLTVTTDTAGTTATTNTNAVATTQKNADGGIYQFTINDTTINGNAYITYKYIQREAAPMVEKETTGTYSSSYFTLIMNNDFDNAFDKDVISITDKNGIQLNRGTDYEYMNDEVTINKTGYYQGDEFTVRYTYRDISMISEKPLTGNVTVDQQTKTKATITLDAALYAGRSCYVKAPLTWQQSAGGSGGITEAIIYDNIVIPSTGIITINAPTTWTKITSGTYEIWVY